MKFGNRYLRLRTAISLFACCIVIFALSVTGVLIGRKEAITTQNNLSQKVLSIAEVVANTPEVIAALDGSGNKAVVQIFANKLLKATGVNFIVVMNMQTVRLSHPNPSLIGKTFVGGDEYAALKGKTYVSEARGTLGTSLRAFVPIYHGNGKEIGVVSVGILLRDVRADISRGENIVYFSIAVGLIVGIFGAILLAASIKRILFGLEPVEIAKLLDERTAMLESVREGVLAVNQEGKVVLINSEAAKMLRKNGITDSLIGEDVESYLPDFLLHEILVHGIPEFHQECEVNGTLFIVNRVPVRVNEEVVGAIATFQDKTEFKQIADQLTGDKVYAEALRVQAHEFMNKLHVILGMLHTKQYDELTTYVQSITDYFHIEVGSIARQIQDPVLAGFLRSKLSYAREQKVQLNLNVEGNLPTPAHSEVMDDIITVVGNLIDNSIEAAQRVANKRIDVTIKYEAGNLQFYIRDNGGGISDELRIHIFTKGFSTKGSARGYGLYLVSQTIKKAGGVLRLKSGKGWTQFEVKIPYTVSS